MENVKKKRPASLRKSKRGIALIVVLSVLALMTVLVLSMFSLADTERRSSAGFADLQQGKGLADTAVNLVIGQLRAATTSRDSSGDVVAWASQPGAIRTWNQNGDFAAGYKLYSDSAMVVTGNESAFGTVKPPGTWNDKSMSLRYTDLNSPVVRGINNSAGTIVQTPFFPIMDPRAAFLGQVEGFALDATFKGTVTPSSATDANARLPMPVEWLYTLRDGTVGYLDDSNNFVSPSGSQATPQNPIVGRVAFWTDDESCKLNLNASSEPTPWDTPRCINGDDLNYGTYQPANREYQRYPGHPFMTALSPALIGNPPANLTGFPPAAWKESLYSLIPRVKEGGTVGATYPFVTGSRAAIVNDSDRLFANTDEFLFSPVTTGTNRVLNTLPLPSSFSPEKVLLLRSFVTTASRSAEVNLFGLPRVSIWPVDADPVSVPTVNGKPRVGTYQRTAFDHLASFCATLGTKTSTTAAQEYYFQRWNSLSATDDWTYIPRNQRLMQYLRAMAAKNVPGYGQSLNAKWTSSESDQVLTEIMDYVRSANLKDPFRSSAWSDGNVIPLQLPLTGVPNLGFGRYFTLDQAGIHLVCTADGNADPNAYNGANPKLPLNGETNGNPNDLGRSTTPLSAGKVQFQCSFLTELFCPSQGFVLNTNNAPDIEVTNLNDLRINQKPLKFFANGSTTIKYTYGDGGGWHINDRMWGGSRGIRPMASSGGYGLSLPFTLDLDASKKTLTLEVANASHEIIVKLYQRGTGNLLQTISLNFPSVNIPVPKLVATGTTPYLNCQATNPVDWWNILARYRRTGSYPYAPGPLEFRKSEHWWPDEGGGKAGFKEGCLFRAEDVIRTLSPAHGDYRLIMAQKVVPSSTDPRIGFKPHYFYEDLRRNLDHVFCEAVGQALLYGFSNEPGLQITEGVKYSLPASTYNDQVIDPYNAYIVQSDDVDGEQLLPISDKGLFPNGMNYAHMPQAPLGAGKYNVWGDFDNGVSHVRDGAYVNKPDEGNFAASGGNVPYFAWNYQEINNTVLFSPARLMPSPGMFGSLPTGVMRNRPWETLLFRPDTEGHPGSNLEKDNSTSEKVKVIPGKTPDHVLMDWFWMPVCEPYALSEPLTSMGKINLNTQMLPFSHIRRNTAIHGLLRSEDPLAIPNEVGNAYKLWDHSLGSNRQVDAGEITDTATKNTWKDLRYSTKPDIRKPIDAAQVVKQMTNKFENGTIYKSGSEICSLHLVRQGENADDYFQSGSKTKRSKFWEKNLLTGDNTRERPYTNLYARLSTKSNAYTVHYRVQSIRMPRSGNPNQLDLNAPPNIMSDQRGSVTLERFLDPSESGIPDYASSSNPLSQTPVDSYYRYRILATRKFEP